MSLNYACQSAMSCGAAPEMLLYESHNSQEATQNDLKLPHRMRAARSHIDMRRMHTSALHQRAPFVTAYSKIDPFLLFQRPVLPDAHRRFIWPSLLHAHICRRRSPCKQAAACKPRGEL